MLANAATMRILIKGGKVVNDDCTLEADVYIENGIIQQVGRELMIPGGAKVIDATGKLVIPGGIDTSTHFHQTFMNATCVDDFYHGTKVPPGHSPPLHSLGLLLPARSARSPSPQLGEGSLAPQVPMGAAGIWHRASAAKGDAGQARAFSGRVPLAEAVRREQALCPSTAGSRLHQVPSGVALCQVVPVSPSIRSPCCKHPPPPTGATTPVPAWGPSAPAAPCVPLAVAPTSQCCWHGAAE